MSTINEALNAQTGAKGALKSALVVMVATVLAMILGSFGAHPSYAEDGGMNSADVAAEVSDGSRSSQLDEAASAAQTPANDSIEDEDNPLALIPSPGYWSLVDVLASIVSTLTALLLFACAMRGEREGHRECERDKRRSCNQKRESRTPLATLIAGIAVAVMSVIAVLITQDFTYEMALFDAWSPPLIAGAVVNLVLVGLEWHRSRNHDDDSGANPAPAAA